MAHTVTGPTVIGRNKDGSVLMIKWETLGQNEAGAWVELPDYGDMTIQVIGTFNAGTCTIQGSNDGSTAATLNDPSSTALAFTAAGMEGVLENPRFIRPSNSNTAGMDIDVILVARRASSMRN